MALPSGGAQQFNQPVDFLMRVIAMRTDAEPAGAMIEDYSRVATAALHLLQIAARHDQRYNTGPFAGSAAAEDFQADVAGALAQLIGQFGESGLDSRNTDLKQYSQACSQAENAGYVECAAFPSAGIR